MLKSSVALQRDGELAYNTGHNNGTGSLRGNFEILIHELAHLVDAPGFRHDGEIDASGKLTPAAQAAQQSNAALVQEKCGKTVGK